MGDILKEAALTIRNLNTELIGLKEKDKEKEIIEKLASEILEKLIERNELKLENVLEKIGELRETSIEDLRILKKALDLTKEHVKLGSLSDAAGNLTTLDPAERFHAFLVEDTEYEE